VVERSFAVSKLPEPAPGFSELCNWHHPALLVKATYQRGLGIFSANEISQGDLLIVFGGRVLTTEQLSLMPPDVDMVIQIEENLFFAPVDVESLGVAERLNHSCSHNAGFTGEMSISAIRDIRAGEEITIDYATCDARPQFGFTCECGTPVCRERVSGRDWQIPALQTRLGQYFQPFLKRRLALSSTRKIAAVAG
jgi:hypothetical protein